MRVPLMLTLAGLLASAPAHAVVIDSADGSGNTTASGDFADPFAHVGTRGVGTGVYLGNGVVLTANHVNAGTLNLGGTNYTMVAGSKQRLHTPGSPGSLVDLALFQIDGDPGLTPLTRGTAVVGSEVRMVGAGLDRATDQTFWDITVVLGPDNDIWTEVTPPPPADAAGYKTLTSRSVRWGENHIDATAGPLVNNTPTLRTIFDSGSSLAHEAQGVNHDSGGSVFQFNGLSNEWELVGIILAVGLFDNQPDGAKTAVYGNATYFADLTLYESQIADYIAAVPTPGTLCLMAAAGATLVFRRGKHA